MRAFPIFASLILILRDDAKEAVFFVGDSRREIDSAAQREKIPQTIKLEWRSIGAHERLDKIARHRIVIVDEAVTKIADPKVAFHESKSPWGIEVSV
jgi:phosphoglycolate phosphatase-like HAD superfamily hydrolase